MSSKRRILISLLFVTICVFLVDQASFQLLQSLFERPLDTSSACACDKSGTNIEPWIMGRFNKSFKPFLARKSSLSEDDFKWWIHLQKRYDHYNFKEYSKAEDKLFQMFPYSSDLTEASPDDCRSCAVVGNSGNLKRSHYGPLIDCHNIIIRMNGGRTKGYETDVGSRTTHHIMYPESAVNLETTTHLVLFGYKVIDFHWLVETFATGYKKRTVRPWEPKIKANKDLVMVLSPAFMRYVHEKWLESSGQYPSTGFLALVLSLHMCDKVSVFGYGADKDGNWNHYYENLKNKKLKTGVHAGAYEYKILQQLSGLQKVEFYEGT